VPRASYLVLRDFLASLPISPEPGHIQIFLTTDGNVAGVSIPANCRATLQNVRWLHRHSRSTSAHSGRCPQTKQRGKPCKNSKRKVRYELRRILESQHFQQPKQILCQQGQRLLGYGTLRMNDDIPSRGNLLPVAADNFSQSPPNAVSQHRTAQRFLYAETKAADGFSTGSDENSKVRTRAALAGAVHFVEFAFPHQPRFARIRVARRRTFAFTLA